MNAAIHRMAARNVLRNRRRSLLTGAAIGLAVAFVWVATALTQGMMVRAVTRATEGILGHVQVHHADWDGDPTAERVLPADLTEKIEAQDPELLVAPRAFGRAFVTANDRSVGALLLGIDPEREAAASGMRDHVEQGTYLDGDDTALVGRRLAEQLEVGPGSTLQLVVQAEGGRVQPLTAKVVGTLASGVVELDESAIAMPLPVVMRVSGLSGPHEIMIRGADPAAADALADRLRASGVAGDAKVESWRTISPDMALWMDFTRSIFAGFAIVIVIAVATAILLTQSMVTFERRRELAMLRAIGLRPGQLLRLLAYESMLLGGAGALLGVVIGTPIVAILKHTGLDLSGGEELELAGRVLDPMVYPPLSADIPVESFICAVLLAGFASVLAGLKAARRPPLEVMREN